MFKGTIIQWYIPHSIFPSAKIYIKNGHIKNSLTKVFSRKRQPSHSHHVFSLIKMFICGCSSQYCNILIHQMSSIGFPLGRPVAVINAIIIAVGFSIGKSIEVSILESTEVQILRYYFTVCRIRHQ